jgi:SAM-dependent methyltransferase
MDLEQAASEQSGHCQEKGNMCSYDNSFWNDAFLEDPDQVMILDLFLDAEVEGLAPGTALDLGCGSGCNALKLAGLGWSVVGVDWSERAIQLATAAAEEQGVDARFCVGDITGWVPQREYDLVICTYALPGGGDTELTLRTAIRALAPGGTLLVAEWDTSMTEAWGFSEGDLPSPEGMAKLLPGLLIETAEVRRVMNPLPQEEPQPQSGTSANVAFVRARKP